MTKFSRMHFPEADLHLSGTTKTDIIQRTGQEVHSSCGLHFMSYDSQHSGLSPVDPGQSFPEAWVMGSYLYMARRKSGFKD